MKLNLQNKIHGMKFATVLLNCYTNDKKKHEYAVQNINYVLNNETIKQIGIPENFIDDIVKQIEEIGSYEKIAEIFKVEPYSGVYQSPLVVRHKEIPQIIAHIVVQDRPTWSDVIWSNPHQVFPPFHGMHKYYDAQLVLNCYIDVSHEGPKEYDKDDEFLKTFDALSSKRLDLTQDELEELMKD